MATPTDPHLWSICTSFYFPRKLTIRSQKTRDRYRIAVSALGRAIGHDPTKDDLNDDNLTIMATDSLAAGLSPATINGNLAKLKTLQTWLAKRGLVPTFPTLDRLDVPEPTPLAWQWDEMRRLFRAGRQEQGDIAGIPAGDWWFAWLNWLWNTSERYGASIALRWDMLDLQAAVASLPASIRKGRRKPAVYSLWPETVESLRRIAEPRRELVFPWPF